LYGLTSRGGVDNEGILFTYDPVTDQFIKRAEFDEETVGAIPGGSLMQASNGHFYGVANWGGEYGCGTIFTYSGSTGILSKLTDLTGPNGKWPNSCTLVEVEDESGISGNDMNLFGIELFPNPCSGTTRLHVTRHESHVTSIDLYTISGTLIKRLSNEVQYLGPYEIEIDVSNLAAGVYFIKMQSGNQVGIKKLIVKSPTTNH
jgi:hypothetical protein